MLCSRTFSAIGTGCQVIAEESVVDAAAGIAEQQLAELDRACSRFRPDSELNRLVRGSAQPVSQLLCEVLAAAIRTATRTRGLVDPTVGHALAELGYDTDFDDVRARSVPARRQRPRAVAGYWRIIVDQETRQVMIPRQVGVDLGASAKAWAADRAARTCGATLGGSFLMNFGGDLAVNGPAPEGGWRVAIDDSPPPSVGGATAGSRPRPRPVVTIRRGGLATSSTAVRTWRQGQRLVHHIIDPRTGDCAQAVWRAVTVVASTCELANAASTASIVLGQDAPEWLARRGLPARLVSIGGRHLYVGEWPEDDPVQWTLSA
jgi:thiamine biosynthesis lipoprotein